MKADIRHPIHMSLGDEIRRRPLRERIRDTLLGIWLVFWLSIGIGLVLLAGSVN